jgi:hypothetical protein
MIIARGLGSAAEILKADLEGLTEEVRRAGVRPRRPTLEKILAWASSSAATADQEQLHHRIMEDFDDDRLAKLQTIKLIEAELAELLVQTPYVLLLGIPDINISSASEFAGEMGPIQHYNTARSITGRAGLFPARNQSDEVDVADGKLIRHANRRLRQAIMRIADNLVECNDHFRILAAEWQLAGKDAQEIRVRVAGRVCRIGYCIVAGRTTYRHPSCQQRDYILRKLIKFDIDHSADISNTLRDLDAAVAQLPDTAYSEEGAALAAELDELQKKRGTGVRSLKEILPVVLANLGVKLLESPASGDAKLT